MTKIPTDHLIDPRRGSVSWWGPPTQPPEGWVRQHQLGEGGGYRRDGRRWAQTGAQAPIRLACLKVTTLYRLLINRIGVEGAAGQGWCVDA